MENSTGLQPGPISVSVTDFVQSVETAISTSRLAPSPSEVAEIAEKITAFCRNWKNTLRQNVRSHEAVMVEQQMLMGLLVDLETHNIVSPALRREIFAVLSLDDGSEAVHHPFADGS